ncbi:NADH:flavin oxidoreductase/NADH oxidase [Mucilaginibacter aquaedulcis]|uniref:NADH:flavin oxidoreductase/NADH oxidase n=1 Tax=Mucilaginibacter aquaedulcis TaxID=1187081 RepID=UPI0025B36951|nr:NADH:flavin oxidoreductase/NADH oxidase [Mucilaginibacter aquaedulcis]MDN3549166.1 NADH:flavin oxidoreductase/NADH oxidase [Mucilaginibacter aquaedulcis]
MAKLFDPLTIKNVTLKNRVIVSPMSQYSAIDGFANDWHFVHLGSRAVGGAALIITEATAVSPEGRISPDDLGIWKDEHIPRLQHIVSFITRQQCIAGIQLSHAGRKASTLAPQRGHGGIPVESGGWQTYAPSPLPYSDVYPHPLELDRRGIWDVIYDFTLAAGRALRAGFGVIEIHAAHGYLLHQFLSPLTNQRTDEYGGSFDGRIRLLLEVIEGIRTVWPAERPLFVRISGTDWADGGLDLKDAIQIAETLKNKGIDVVDVTTGGLVSTQKIPVGPGYQLTFASNIRKRTGILTGTVGLITDAVQAETLLTNGDADMVMIARELLRDPYFPLKAAYQLHTEVTWPHQYRRAKPV